MSEQVNKEQAKGMKQENVTELTDDQLDEVAGGEICATDNVPQATLCSVDLTDEAKTGDAVPIRAAGRFAHEAVAVP